MHDKTKPAQRNIFLGGMYEELETMEKIVQCRTGGSNDLSERVCSVRHSRRNRRNSRTIRMVALDCTE
jgi:hypothetical protein